MLQQGTAELSPVTVSGTVCDSTSTITAFSINGEPVALAGDPPCQTFTTTMESRWGLNVIEAAATNTSGFTRTAVQSFLRSAEYASVPARAGGRVYASQTSDKVPAGVYTQLNSKIIDDRDRRDIDDLATLVYLALENADFSRFFPFSYANPDADGNGEVDWHTCSCTWPLDPIAVQYTGYRVGVGSLSIDNGVKISNVALRNGQIYVDMTLPRVISDVVVTGYLSTCVTACVARGWTVESAYGSIEARSIRMQVAFDVSAGSGGGLVVRVVPGTLSTTVDSPLLTINLTALDFLGPVVEDIANATIRGFEQKITDVVDAVLAPRIGDLVTELLESFDLAEVVTLPDPLNTAVNLGTEFDRIDIKPGSARVGIAVGVSPVSPVPPGSRGAVRRGGGVPSFDEAPYAMGVGIKDDLLNQFLWAVWRGGGLDISGLSALGCGAPDGFEAQMFAQLPPVVMPGSNGHEVDIGLGGVYITAGLPANAAAGTAPPRPEVEMYVSTTVGASLDIDPDAYELGVSLQDDPEVFVEIISAPEGADLDLLRSQYSDLFECIMSTLLRDLMVAFPLPVFDPGAMGFTGVPSDLVWKIGSGNISREDPYYKITGDVDAQRGAGTPPVAARLR